MTVIGNLLRVPLNGRQALGPAVKKEEGGSSFGTLNF